MITDAIVSAFTAAISALLTLAPTVTLPSDTASSYLGVFRVVNTIKDIIPITAIAEVALVYWAAVILMQVWDFGVWAFHQIHGSD